MSILAVVGSMALFPASMRAAAKILAANHAAAHFLQPAWLILQSMFAAETPLIDQEWAFGAGFVVSVAIVSNLRVATSLEPMARKTAWRRLRPARQWRLNYRLAAMARDFLEDSFAASVARPTMTKLGTFVVTTFEGPPALPGADVLCFESFQHRRSRVQRPRFAFCALPLASPAFACTAPLLAIMPPTT
jgi:hypothetical protein